MKGVLIVGVMVAATACETIQSGADRVREFSAARAGDLVIGACKLADETRKKNLDAVQAYLRGENVKHRATAVDCDGDGAPDF